MLTKASANFASINYTYVLSKRGKLRGIVSIKELFRYKKSTHVKEVMRMEMVTVRAHTDQEKVALLAIEHSIKALPVVDKHKKFIGVVSFDTILDVLHTESIEDTLRFAGAGKLDNPAKDIISAPARVHIRVRLPWLLLGLFGGIAAALVVRFFEDIMQEQLVLAAFIPAIVYMADAVGAQTQTIFIRSLALDQALDIRRYVLREIRITTTLAMLLGILSWIVSLLWIGSVSFSAIVGISIATTVVAAMAIALVLPWGMGKLGYDPAIASGPFATVIRDIISLCIYFGVALVLL
jgi:magnesium transporter